MSPQVTVERCHQIHRELGDTTGWMSGVVRGCQCNSRGCQGQQRISGGYQELSVYICWLSGAVSVFHCAVWSLTAYLSGLSRVVILYQLAVRGCQCISVSCLEFYSVSQWGNKLKYILLSYFCLFVQISF